MQKLGLVSAFAAATLVAVEVVLGWYGLAAMSAAVCLATALVIWSLYKALD